MQSAADFPGWILLPRPQITQFSHCLPNKSPGRGLSQRAPIVSNTKSHHKQHTAGLVPFHNLPRISVHPHKYTWHWQAIRLVTSVSHLCISMCKTFVGYMTGGVRTSAFYELTMRIMPRPNFEQAHLCSPSLSLQSVQLREKPHCPVSHICLPSGPLNTAR